MRKVYLLLAVIFVIVSGCAQDDTQEGNQAGNQAVLENTVLDESIPTEPEDLVNEIPKYSDAPTSRTTSTSTATQISTSVVAATSEVTLEPTNTLEPYTGEDTDSWAEYFHYQSALKKQQESSGLSSGTGPWLIITTSRLGIWAVDPDGENIVQLVPWRGETNPAFRVLPSPNGSNLVIISGDDPGFGSPRMYVFNFPYARLLLEQDLMSEYLTNSWADSSRESTWRKYIQAYYAVYENGSWAPDGEKFAFVAALDGDSADVYVYNRGSNSFQQLTTGSTHAVDLVWSRDSNHIVHGAVSSLNAWSSGRGYSDYLVWDVNISNGVIKQLDGGIDYGFERLLGWVSDTTYLADKDELGRGSYNLRIASLDGSVVAELLCENYGYREFDPISKLLVVHSIDFYQEADDCDQFDGSGYYIYQLVGDHLELINKLPDRSDVYVGEPFFEPNHGLFFIPQGDEGWVTVDRDAVFTVVAYEHPEWGIDASPDGEGYFDGDYIYWKDEVIDIESKLPPGVNAYEGSWSPDGEAFAFIAEESDNTLVYIAHAPDFEPILVFSVPYELEFSGALIYEYLTWVGE